MTEHRHNRVARWVFRIGTAASMLIVAAWVISIWWDFAYVHGKSRGGVGVEDNVAFVDWGFSSPTTGGWIIRNNKRPRFWPGLGLSTGKASIPLWALLLISTVPTLLAWRRLRRPLPGHCRKCGYDLTGNVTGVCSECGKDVEGKVPSE